MNSIEHESLTYAAVHEKMIKYVWLSTEILLNDEIYELSEYDIQAMIFTYFTTRMKNLGITGTYREKQGRTDIVVESDFYGKAFLELKTYFKKNEFFTEKHFSQDLTKLVEKAQLQNSREFFIIAGRNNKIVDRKIEKYNFMVGKYLKLRNQTTYTIPGSKDEIVIRPSVGRRMGMSFIWSWEILKKNLK